MNGDEGSDDLFLYLALVGVALALLVAGALSSVGSYSPLSDSLEDGGSSDSQNVAEDGTGKLGKLASEQETRTSGTGGGGGGGESSGTTGGGGSGSEGVGKEELQRAVNEGDVDSEQLGQAVDKESGEVDSEGVEDAVDEDSEVDPEEVEKAVEEGEISPEELEQILSGANATGGDTNTSASGEGRNETDTQDGGVQSGEGSGNNTGGGGPGTGGGGQNTTEGSGETSDNEGGSTGGGGGGNSTASEAGGDGGTEDGGGAQPGGGSDGFSPSGDLPTTHLLGVVALVLVLLGGYLYRRYGLPEYLRSPRKFVSALTKVSFDLAQRAESAVRKALNADSYAELLRGFYAWFVGALVSALRRGEESEPSPYGVGGTASVEKVAEGDGATARDFVHEAWSVVLDASAHSRPETKTPGQVSKDAVSKGLPRDPVVDITEAFRDVEYGGVDPSAKVDDVERALSELRERTAPGDDADRGPG